MSEPFCRRRLLGRSVRELILVAGLVKPRPRSAIALPTGIPQELMEDILSLGAFVLYGVDELIKYLTLVIHVLTFKQL